MSKGTNGATNQEKVMARMQVYVPDELRARMDAEPDMKRAWSKLASEAFRKKLAQIDLRREVKKDMERFEQTRAI